MRHAKLFEDERIAGVRQSNNVWTVWIGKNHDLVQIRVKKEPEGYVHESSHYLHAGNNSDVYIASDSHFDTEEQALAAGIREKLFFYDDNDKQKQWVRNSDF